MNDAASPATHADPGERVEALIRELEQQMPDLQLRHGSVFALANAWAERHDAIVAATAPAMRAAIEARLSRIGIRWGVMPGARVTTEFRALGHRQLVPAHPADAHDAATAMARTSASGMPLPSAPMTTSSQQTVLSAQELECLRDCARGVSVLDHAATAALVAKGMLEADDARHALTPAGQHALHVDAPGAIPGIDT